VGPEASRRDSRQDAEGPDRSDPALLG
jgi:hypothetical protein